MEHAHDLIRPWRRATIAVSAVAAVELVLLAGLAVALLGNPLARDETSVMVLNGNGRAGAAAAAADRVKAKGYIVGDVGNAAAISPRTVVMYRPGYGAEASRLGRDLRIRVIRPLDGMSPRQLMGAHLVLILGT